MNQPRNSLILAISRTMMGEWDLKDGATVPVTCGRLQGEAVVHELHTDAFEVSLAWENGRLDWRQRGLSGQVARSEDGRLRIGPMIGILTTGVRDDEKRPVGGRTGLLGDFVRAARERNATCFIFDASAVDWSSGTVRGVTLVGDRGRETWRFFRFPLPDVVYNRVPHRSAELSNAVRVCKDRCSDLGIPLFNERFINKKEMYAWLVQDETTRDLIPATQRLRSADSLRRFCSSHSLVYLKPTGGSLGNGIVRVLRAPETFRVRYRRDKRHQTSEFARPESLFHFVKTLNPGRIYLMQQGIRLMKYEGNSTDFRVHLHKNGEREWETAGIGAKVAGRGAVTTHVHNGGRVVAGDVVLEAWYGERAPQMRQRLIDAAVRVARSLEGMLDGPVGEWGLDAGIDEDGRIWVFESNAKPGRAIFRHPDLREAGRKSAKLLVDYASALALYPVRTRGGSP